jgi:hypothetical protein
VLNTYLLTVSKAGTGAGTVTSSPAGISCGADCTETYGHGQMVTLSQSASAGSVFAGWTGACTGSGACVVTMDMARSVTATFNIQTFTLTVVNASSAGGQGTITDNFGGISCGANCTEVYTSGTTVTLTANPGTASNFIGWSGGGCSGLELTCKVDMTSNLTVTGTFSAPNIIFVTSKPYGGNFAANSGGRPQDYADAECQAVAASVGLVGSGPGRNLTFRAWLSSNSSAQGGVIEAKSRFDGSNGWVRTRDYRPVMSSISDIGSSKIWYPPRNNESGVDLGPDVQIWTGTNSDGGYSGDSCFEGGSWQSSSGSLLGTSGLPSATGSPISEFRKSPCSSANRRLLCMGLGRNTSVGAPPVAGKLAFTTAANWTPNAAGGIDSADALCRMEAGAANLPGASTFRALLTPAGGTAIGRFASTGVPWVRVGDLQPLTTTEAAMFSTATTQIEVAPNVTASGNRIGNETIWSGAQTITTTGVGAQTCGDWKDPTEFKGSGGTAFDTGMRFHWFGSQSGNYQCSIPRRVVCLQP